MKKLFTLFAFSIAIFCGCTEGAEEVSISTKSATGVTTRAADVVVWEAQPGTIDIPAGQAVTIGLDGSVTK